MAKSSRLGGSTSNMLLLFIQDTSQTDGRGLTGLVYNSAGLTAYYKRGTGTASVAITLATIATLGTYAAGGFKEVDATHMPGVYEFHPPDAAFAGGAKSVVFALLGATNMAQNNVEIELTAVDNQDATAFGVSRIDAAISSRSTYAGTDTAGTTTLLSRLTAARAGYLDLLNTFLDSAVSAVKTVVDAIKAKTDNLPANPAAQTNLDVAVSTRLSTAGYTAPDNADIVAIKAKTDNLPAAPADETLLIAATNAILARTDVATSTRLAGSAYSAPDNAGIAEIAADVDAIKAKTDLITSGTTITVVTTSVVEGNAITVYQGTHWRIQLLGLGDLSLRTKLYFTVKRKTSDEDADAIAQLAVSKPGAGSDGLLVMNAATATGTLADGSIVVDNEVLGNITINVKLASTAGAAPASGLLWDVKAEGADADNLPREVARGTFTISQGETRAIS